MFGLRYELLIKGETKFKTSNCAYLTILYCLIVIGLFIGFGVDCKMRRNPKVIFNKNFKEYKNIKVNNQNTTQSFRIENFNKILYKNDSLHDFHISIKKFKLEKQSGIWNDQSDIKLDM